jgi:hypothetical protein
MNCAAPDEGNIHLLVMVGTEQQKARYLGELILALTCMSARSVVPLVTMSRAGPSQWRA